MKKLLMFSAILFLSTSIYAQKGKEKNQKENKAPKKEVKTNAPSKATAKSGKKPEDIIWEGTKDTDGGGPKPSKNQPAKVRDAFSRDYPNATNVRWSKYRGDWTATFNNGLVTSTAVYHANGQRKDTRTVVSKNEIPRSIIDVILKRDNAEPQEAVKVERAGKISELIYRIKTRQAETTKYSFFDRYGKEVNYNY